MTTFKELSNDVHIDFKIIKIGLSIGIVFPKDFCKKYNLKYEDVIRLDNAETIPFNN